MNRLTPPLLALLALTAAACAAEGQPPVEGDEAGECRDGADNDQDGWFDCDDQGCWGSPDCEGEDTGRDPGDDSGDTGGPWPEETCAEGSSAPRYPDWQTLRVRYDYVLDINPQFEGYLSDCAMVFEGEAEVVGGHGDFLLAFGSWERTASTCAPDMEAAIWVSDGRDVWHSLVLSEQGARLESWTVHMAEDDCDPEGTNGKFWASEMAAGVDGAGRATYHHEGEVISCGYNLASVSEDLSFELSD